LGCGFFKREKMLNFLNDPLAVAILIGATTKITYTLLSVHRVIVYDRRIGLGITLSLPLLRHLISFLFYS
jgi:hypothetical protein